MLALVLGPTWGAAQNIDFAAQICESPISCLSADFKVDICDSPIACLSAEETWNNVGACSNMPNVALDICDSPISCLSADLEVDICDSPISCLSADRSFCVTNANSLDEDTLERLRLID